MLYRYWLTKRKGGRKEKSGIRERRRRRASSSNSNSNSGTVAASARDHRNERTRSERASDAIRVGAHSHSQHIAGGNVNRAVL